MQADAVLRLPLRCRRRSARSRLRNHVWIGAQLLRFIAAPQARTLFMSADHDGVRLTLQPRPAATPLKRNRHARRTGFWVALPGKEPPSCGWIQAAFAEGEIRLCRYADAPASVNTAATSPAADCARPLPPMKVRGIRWARVMKIGSKAHALVDLGASVWESAGIAPGSGIVVRRFADGVKFELAPAGAAPDFVVRAQTVDGHPRAFKRISTSIWPALQHLTDICIGTGERSVIMCTENAARRCFGKKLQQAASRLVSIAANVRVAYQRARNFNEVRDPGDGKRLQVQGLFLLKAGFVPGTRYRIEPDPLFSNRLRLQRDADGPHRVTALHAGTNVPKLYVPAAALKPIRRQVYRITAVDDGVVVHGLRVYAQGADRPRTRQPAGAAVPAEAWTGSADKRVA